MAENKHVSKEDVQLGEEEGCIIPVEIVDNLSETSSALECFTQQRFSRKLQEYLINYRNLVVSDYSVTDE